MPERRAMPNNVNTWRGAAQVQSLEEDPRFLYTALHFRSNVDFKQLNA